MVKIFSMFVVLGWSGYLIFRNANLSLHRSFVAFRLEEQGGVVLVLRSGKNLRGKVSSDSLVTLYLVVLNIFYSERSGGCSLLIMPDAMDSDSFRRLRVALRWGNKAG
jgi:toxin CptA